MLPLLIEGEVVHGYGRGQYQLGIPTANIDEKNVSKQLPRSFKLGIYYGWAQFSSTEMNEDIMETVVSIGLNPFYKNRNLTMEVHILKEFRTPFYGKTLKGFLRAERDFPSKELLIDAIRGDINEARRLLREDDEQIRLRDLYFHVSSIYNNYNNNPSSSHNK